MSVSRRTFLVAGQTLLAAAALPLKFFGAATSEFGSANTVNLASWTKRTFEPLVSSSFAVHSGAQTTAWFTLLSVEDMNSKTPTTGTTATFGLKTFRTTQPSIDTFALNFHGTGEALQQGTYELEHHSLGRFSLFVVPSGATTYTAIVSHIESAAPIRAPKRLNRKAQTGAPTAPESL
jgi:hypothetical protein